MCFVTLVSFVREDTGVSSAPSVFSAVGVETGRGFFCKLGVAESEVAGILELSRLSNRIPASYVVFGTDDPVR